MNVAHNSQATEVSKLRTSYKNYGYALLEVNFAERLWNLNNILMKVSRLGKQGEGITNFEMAYESEQIKCMIGWMLIPN